MVIYYKGKNPSKMLKTANYLEKIFISWYTMKRLLKISFDQALLSLTPILTWFCLSILIDRDLINVFTIVYPLQMLYGVIRAPFATGANISRVKDKNKHAAMSGMILGIILTVAVFGFVLLNVDGYITFMSVDSATYRTFTIYAIGILILQTIGLIN